MAKCRWRSAIRPGQVLRTSAVRHKLSTFAEIKARQPSRCHKPKAAAAQRGEAEDDELARHLAWSDAPLMAVRDLRPQPRPSCAPSPSRAARLDRTVRIRAQAMATDKPMTFRSARHARGRWLQHGQDAGGAGLCGGWVGPGDIDVVDCTTASPRTRCSPMRPRLCPERRRRAFILDGDNSTGQGRHQPVRRAAVQGHPLGATGPRPVHGAVEQLRATPAARQVEGARLALQTTSGSVVPASSTVYERV